MKKKLKSLIGLLLAGALCLTGCGGGSAAFTDEAVMKIDGHEIMKSEYMVYLYTTTMSFVSAAGEDVWNMDFDGQTADELVEERTISTIQSVIAAKEFAAANGIELSDEQKAEAAAAAEQFLSELSEVDLAKMGADVEKLIPMMEDSYLYTLVYDVIATECDVDMVDLETYYQENRERLAYEYASLDLETVLLDDLATAEEVAERARSGEDVSKLFAEYDVDPTDMNSGAMSIFQAYLQSRFGLTEDLEVGDVAGPLQYGANYFVLKVTDKTVPMEADVKVLAENEFRAETQAAYTEARLAELAKGQKVEKIESVWNTLEKFH
ncbi:MAG: peptidyl-prolyl cis-trans isomerase [Anaerotignum sp.]|nr:peptidyl-prolyl cis-trans isomerase [Anaerotignum sp.]